MRTFQCISVKYFKEYELLIWKIKNIGIPNFCLNGLREFAEFAIWVKEYFAHPNRPLKYVVSGSDYQSVYNMGGDLYFFLQSIKNNNQSALREYAHLCVDAIYNIYTSFNLPVITIALVEGNAYGGGFECALAHDYIIAEQDTQFCLPEQKFNLFPGMGAYSLLSRKLKESDMDAMIREGNIYKAQELNKMGLIEILANKGEAMLELHSWMKQLTDQFNFEYHHVVCKKEINQLEKKELLKITDIWVDACSTITPFDLRKMEVLSNAQYRKAKIVA